MNILAAGSGYARCPCPREVLMPTAHMLQVAARHCRNVILRGLSYVFHNAAMSCSNAAPQLSHPSRRLLSDTRFPSLSSV